MKSRRNGFSPRSAERVAREIELDIIENELQSGDWLGSESELMDLYGVSRGVIREAVTLVEHHLQATTRRGAGGGVVVAEPNVRVISEIASLYLARKKVAVGDLVEIRILLETKAIEQIMATLDETAVEALREEVSREVTAADDLAVESERFHILLAELSGNGVLEMLIPILSGLVKEVWTAHHRRPTARQHKALWATVTQEHSMIVDAIVAGNIDMARAAAAKHLSFIGTDLDRTDRVIPPLDMAGKTKPA